MKCPKCGYTRRMGETAPDWQCPSCGIAYAKADAPAGERARARPSSGGGGQLVLAILAVAVVAVAGVTWKATRPAPGPAAVLAEGQASVIMYSLTTCGFCTQKRAQLTAAGIPFVEYFLDKDEARFQELIRKLEASGMKPGGIGTPSFEVNGKLLLNNPSLETIRSHL